jgi:hypothetical protein
MTDLHPVPDSRRLKVLAACAFLASLAAQAQEQRPPYRIGVSQAVTRDSNVFRTAGAEVSSTVSSTGLVAGLNQHFGRQRVYVDTDAQINRYSGAETLNNKSYAVTTGLDWETIETLSGNLRYSRRNSLADLGITGGTPVISDQITDHFIANARYGLPSKFSFDLGYEYRKLHYDNAALANRNYSQDVVSASMRWGLGGQLTLGFGGRATNGSTPQYSNVPPYEDELTRRDIDLFATWSASGFSNLSARLSRTREKHTIASNTASSETTGSVSWTYLMTGRLTLVTSVTRDTGTETMFIAGTPSSTDPLTVDNSRISTSYNLDSRYSLTGKTSLSGLVRHRRGTLADSTREAVNSYQLGWHYTATRVLSFNCTVARENRSVAGNRAYDSTLTGCSGELIFQ